MSEAFICDAIRTPFGRYGGALSGVRPDDLAAHLLRALQERNSLLDLAMIDDVVLGCANQAGEDNRNVARMAVLLAGYPVGVPGSTINRLCGSGLDALAIAARAIRSGEAELVIAGGVESMSRAPFVIGKASQAFARDASLFDTTMGWRFINPKLQQLYGTETMPETAENVAAEYRISRADQDGFALRSQQRALQAQAAGLFDEEIRPVSVAGRKGEVAIVSHDEHPRETTMQALAKLPTPFREGGSVTAGNASGINDGACALIVASESAVKRHHLTPLARIAGTAVAGVEPRLMGIGPVPATRKLLGRLGMTVDQMDLLEFNEAFAAQVLAVTRELGIADDSTIVNANGGAIALGHPLGASGARLATTALYNLRRIGGRRALCAMCIGVGQGIAIMIERV